MITILNVSDATGLIVDCTEGPDASYAAGRAGCHLVTLDDAQLIDYRATREMPNGGVIFNGATFAVVPVPAPPAPTAAVMQRIADAATLLNASAVRDSQAHRDAFARLIQCQALTIPLNQDATTADIRPL